ncbi:MAG: type II secretion system secretin GspD, partial [Thiohalomonadales bacterium]|nr:type II secretion system secretin GspD [Thiohalomonadales bacterium]
ITHKSMTKDEVYEVFQSVLKVHGFAAVPGKSVIKIVPEVNAKQDSIKTIRDDYSDGDELVTKVIPIRHVTAAQLVPILRPLVPQRGHLAAYPQSNVLIISDSASNIERLSAIIDRIDQSVNQEIEVLPLQHAVASEVVRVVNQLHAGAKEKPDYTIVADDRTNSVLLGGDKGERLRLRAIITHMDIPLELSGNTQVIYLRYASAVDLVKTLTDVSKTILKTPSGKTAAAATTTSASDINIQADESTNALIINAPPGVMRSLRSVVSQLDIRREQVHIEAILAEVSYTKASQLGVQWAFDGSEGGTKSGPIGILNFSSFAPPGLAGLLEQPPLVGDGLSLGLGRVKDGDLTMGALVRALATDGNTNILSQPSIVTLDNQEATIVVGQNVPFLTGSYTTTTGDATNPFQTIDRQDVGITLKITPQINEGNTIKMQIDQEISNLTPASTSVDIIIGKRQITTNVMVDDNQILVLGGLIEDQLRDTEAKIPGLGDIPLLGWMFKYKTVDKVKTNLMVFIHPTILQNEAMLTKVTGQKYNYIRDKELESQRRGLTLLRDKELPVMREFSAVMPLPPRYLPTSDGATIQDAPPIQ